MSEYYVVIKLVSGEQVMATLVNEDEYTIEIKNALSIKLRLVSDGDRQFESISVVPFCQFTDDPNFVLDKSIIIYVKELAESLAIKYENLVESEFSVNVTDSPTDVDDLVSKINKVAEKLKDGGVFVDNFEEEDLPPFLINGTDTIQ